MKVRELIAELAKVSNQDAEVYVHHNGEGVHLKIRRVEFAPEEGQFDDDCPMKDHYPLIVPEE